ICDLVQTGSTLKANGLKPFVEILKSQAVLIQSPVNNSFNNLFTCKLSIPNKTI
ncbi:hypothetical protein KJ742_07295, partial [Patescibacteria group bacterium]|nr:hypothetical protein [Patescibacteria group bacterium]